MNRNSGRTLPTATSTSSDQSHGNRISEYGLSQSIRVLIRDAWIVKMQWVSNTNTRDAVPIPKAPSGSVSVCTAVLNEASHRGY
eukprot:g80748.t1